MSARHAVLASIALFVSGCSNEATLRVSVKKVQVDLDVPGTTRSPLSRDGRQLTGDGGIPAYSFTPSVFRVPVKGVYLAGPNSPTQTLFSCTGSVEECLVDLLDQASLDAMAARAATTLPPGTWTEAVFTLCAPGDSQSDNHVFVQGSWRADGATTYHTTSRGDDPISTNAADLGELRIPMSTCQLNMAFSRPLEVTAGSTASVTLFPVTTGAAWFLADRSDPNGNCTGSLTEAVCVNYPNLVPYVGTGSGHLESYAVRAVGAEPDATYGLVHLLFDDGGNAFGGMTFKYHRPFTPENAGKPFGQALRQISRNADRYDFETYGSNPTADRYGYLNWTGFTRIANAGSTLEQAFASSMDGQTLAPVTPCTVERVDPAALVDGTM